MVLLPQNYGYVILIAVVTMFTVRFFGAAVMKARKVYGVRYPDMYAVKGVTSRVPETTDERNEQPLLCSDGDCDAFNCYQRAHQNTLEVLAEHYVLLLLGGLQHPIIASVAGLVWLAGRIAYATGYYTGKPTRRLNGLFAYLGTFTLLGLVLKLAIRLLMGTA